jgi:hypothetical protein
VLAGTTMATIGGNGDVFAFDFGAMDARIAPLAFANPTRFSSSPNGDDERHTVCPLDYFTTPAANQLRGFLGGFDGDFDSTDGCNDIKNRKTRYLANRPLMTFPIGF